MMFLDWSESYRVGDERIDQQHRRLFELANVLFAAKDQQTLQACGMNLYNYVRVHFSDEEALMREVRFPGYREHVALHNDLMIRLSGISQDIGKGQWNQLDIQSFMSDWLLLHILQEDAKLASYIQRAKDASSSST